MYENVIKNFEDTIDVNDIFNSFSFNYALNTIKESTNYLKFLIGIPGSGKTFLINYYKTLTLNSIILQGTISKEELDTYLSQPVELFIIDEAQLLDIKIIEYIRTLTDTKKYNFLLSMHLKEAKEILSKEHFKSRSIDIIELNPITKEEMIQYLNTKLIKNNANYILTKKEFNKIFNYTNGNFRYIKKFTKTLFELLEFAYQNNLSKYRKINNCLLSMTALKLGIEK